MSFTRQASGRLLRRGIEGWPHCPPAFWTVTLWRLSTHTYTWSKLKPLWPTAQAQYDPLFQHQHNLCGLKHKRVCPAASLFLSLICSKELRLCRTTSSHPDNPSAPGELLFMHLVLCSFRLLGFFCTWFSSWNTLTDSSSCFFFPPSDSLSGWDMHRIYLFISLKIVDVWFEMCRVNCTRISRRQLWLPDSHFGICWQTFTAALRTGGSHFLFQDSCN